MPKDTRHEAAKAITKLGHQQERRKAFGDLRDAVKDNGKNSNQWRAADLNGDLH